MANHLPIHHAVISRLSLYLSTVRSNEVKTIIEKQILVMENHIKTMNELLNPNQQQAQLPPIPTTVAPLAKEQQLPPNLNLTEKDIVIDCHFTATSMAKENFSSSENMRDPLVKKIHSEMALQQSNIAEMYGKIRNVWEDYRTHELVTSSRRADKGSDVSDVPYGRANIYDSKPESTQNESYALSIIQ